MIATSKLGDGNNNDGAETENQFYVSKSGTRWEKPDQDLRQYQFEPHHFLRSHNKDNISEAPRTPVWDVQFEPGKPEVVATCGGRFVCVFNINTGDLLLKYEHSEDVDLFTLSWATKDFGNILASGSNTGEIRLYDMDREVSFYNWIYKKGVAINAAQFHSEESSWLLTASKDGMICLWDIGQPSPPKYKNTGHRMLLKVEYEGNTKDLYSMAWVAEAGSGWVLVGSMDGLAGWRISSSKVKEKKFPQTKPVQVEFRLQGVPDLPHVDSVCSLGDQLVAVKCVDHAKIIVFRTNFNKLRADQKMVKVENLMEFAWRKTTNFYMNIGGLSSLQLLACGDNKGLIWIYKMSPWAFNADAKKPEVLPQKVAPLGLFPWPELQVEDGAEADEEADVKPMINKVAMSPNGKFMVGVTDHNIVAIWKKSG